MDKYLKMRINSRNPRLSLFTVTTPPWHSLRGTMWHRPWHKISNKINDRGTHLFLNATLLPRLWHVWHNPIGYATLPRGPIEV
jgi:hypothetical protein